MNNRLPESLGLKPARVDSSRPAGMPRRPAWRQRLVEAERGMTYGLRRDSSLFFHFFAASVVVAVAAVLGLTLTQWTLLVLAFTVVLTAEMLNQVLRTILPGRGADQNDATRRALRIGTAAVFVAMTGAAVATLLIFVQRLERFFVN